MIFQTLYHIRFHKNNEIRNSGEQQRLWERLWDKYRRTYSYASGITLEECLNEIVLFTEKTVGAQNKLKYMQEVIRRFCDDPVKWG
ncbi:hypothetical protein AGMMS49983_02440 [Clostridia bacterium]|nr:hypothetical protein AGMMS49983_02440 [Clostridia bacterium]